jgi:pimeloyl-ACP methyl ester carboxylesterase
VEGRLWFTWKNKKKKPTTVFESMKRSLKWPLRLGISLGILYAGICFYMKWSQQSFLFHPVVVAEAHNWNLPASAKEVWLATEDGARINGIYATVDSARGAVLYLHGNGGNVGSAFQSHERFTSLGYNVLYVDYRGYGKSQGKMYEQGLHYDAEAAYEFLKSNNPESPITIYGESLGSGIATHLAAKSQPKLLILETPYTSILDVAKNDFPWLPISMLLDFPLKSKEQVEKVKCPVLIFHGTADKTIPYTMGQEMAKAANKGKLVTLPGVGHGECSKMAAYQEELVKALNN